MDESGLNSRDRPALMRYLARHYPRNQMGWVYFAVTELYGE